MDLEELGWLGEENFFLEFVSLEWDLGDCFLKGDAYFVLLEEDVFDALLGEDGFLCLDANLFLGVEDVCLLGDLFCVDSALLGEGVGDAPPGLDVDLVLLEEGAGDDPLGLFGVLVDLGFEPRDLDLLIVRLLE